MEPGDEVPAYDFHRYAPFCLGMSYAEAATRWPAPFEGEASCPFAIAKRKTFRFGSVEK